MRGLEAMAVFANVCHVMEADILKEYRTLVLPSLWKRILLNQFHDVIPGSSIAQVYVDSNAMLSEVLQEIELRRSYLSNLLLGDVPSMVYYNMTPYSRQETLMDGTSLLLRPFAFGLHSLSPLPKTQDIFKASAEIRLDGCFVLENAHLRALLSSTGALLSLIDKEEGRFREVIKPGLAGNNLVLYKDVPFFWSDFIARFVCYWTFHNIL